MAEPHKAAENAQQYARLKGLELLSVLGGGVNGSVWYSNAYSAVKAFDRADAYERERDAYLRLADNHVNFINEFAVPALKAFDDTLHVVEMEIVEPPFVLDFAGAYLDNPPQFSADVLVEQEARNAELFGSKWPRVRLLLAELRGMEIYYVDINRGNIRFPEFDDA
jgi:hypothetical protein